MTLRTGLAAQLGIAQETTFGTRNVPDHFYELVSETMKLNKTRTPAKGIRPGKLLQRGQRFRTTHTDVTGDLSLEVASNSFGLLFKHCLGAVTTTADGAGKKHSCTVGDTFGLSLTAQIGTPNVNGTVDVFEYTGCKVSDWELSTAVDQVLALKLTLDGVAETTNQTLASPSWPSNTTNEVFFADEVALTINSVVVPVKDLSITGKNNMKVDRFFLGSKTKSEQLLNAYMDITGTVTPEWLGISQNLYSNFVNDTLTAALVVTCTGSKTYDTAKPNKIVVTIPCIRYDGTSPDVSGYDVVDQPLPFTVLDDDTNQPITIDYYTADTTP